MARISDSVKSRIVKARQSHENSSAKTIENYYDSWKRFLIKFNTTDDNIHSIEEWCEANVSPRNLNWILTIARFQVNVAIWNIQFKYEKNAMMFVLRFGQYIFKQEK